MAGEVMHYYQHHIGDFRSGTVNMSRQARWIYRDMLDVYYDTEKPLPLDIDRLCDELGADSDDDRRIVERILRFKFVKTEHGYHHKRCEKEIAEYRAKTETAKANGKRGGRPPKANGNQEKPSGFPSGSDLVAISNPKQTGSETNHEPLTINQKPKRGEKSASAIPPVVDRPDDVPEQVWADWLQLRKTKRAPVTMTVLDGAKSEAVKAGMTLEDFLRVWCRRGSQGLEAAWLKPDEINRRAQSVPNNRFQGAGAAIFEGAEHV